MLYEQDERAGEAHPPNVEPLHERPGPEGASWNYPDARPSRNSAHDGRVGAEFHRHRRPLETGPCEPLLYCQPRRRALLPEHKLATA